MHEEEAAPALADFASLELPQPLLRLLTEVGYETPSPIQIQTIPHLLAGHDILGQAQTGTGKTAAFALPILARLTISPAKIQALVLAPTRELAIQVAEAFQRYATYVPGFRVLPIYGGQSYGPQLSALHRGVHVVVGTPGRILDHLSRGSLDLSSVRTLVLDEADEMLRMGFIDDVESIIAATPKERQTALFSATLPAPIRRIAQTSMRSPIEVTIAARTRTADNIRQRYWQVSGMHKLDALTRILEAEPFDAMIVFARTKQSTDELAERLQARGFAAASLNGDVAQAMRERTVQALKDGKIDILVATDVAARGLDVDRVSHVINYDMPTDSESYVHRIGRTGRAGRSGEAILFIAPRERGMLRVIERATRQAIMPMELPTVKAVNDLRISKFKQQIRAALAADDLAVFRGIIEEYEREEDVPAVEIAAALAKIAQGDAPFLMPVPTRPPPSPPPLTAGRPRHDDRHSERQGDRPVDRGDDRRSNNDRQPPPELALYRVEVGTDHGVRPGNLVGAIANEAGITSAAIGRIEIFADHSLIELPDALPPEVLRHLGAVWCGGVQLKIARESDPGARERRAPRPRTGGHAPPFQRGARGTFRGAPGRGKAKPRS
jgi:ATP-dependent RNA helicase DeaD